MMKSTELQAIRESLVAQKSSILNRQKEFKSEALVAGPIADETEQIAVEQEQSLGLHLREKERQVLLQIERALSKISDGTYGQCECCLDPIGLKRLQVRPFTNLCIACMEEQESGAPLYQ